MKHLFTVAFGICLFALQGHAEQAPRRSDPNRAAPQATAPSNDGEIRNVDRSTGKITIKHGPLIKLNMPAMTMAFRVKDPSLLDAVKPSDRVKFDAEHSGGAFVVTRIERAR